MAVIDTGVFNHEQLHVEPVADLVSRLRTTHYSTATGTAPSSRASSEPNNRALHRTHRSCPSDNPRRTTAPASRTTRQTISTHPMPRNRSSPALSAVLPRPSTPRLTMTHRSSTPQWFPASHQNTQSIYTHKPLTTHSPAPNTSKFPSSLPPEMPGRGANAAQSFSRKQRNRRYRRCTRHPTRARRIFHAAAWSPDRRR